MTAPVVVTIEGLRVVSEANTRTHWSVRHRRNRGQQDLVRAALLGLDRAAYLAAPRLRVVLTRVMGPRGREFDSDGLTIAFKFCRDAVAAWLGVDDGSDWYDWRVNPRQERGPHYAVRIGLQPLTGGDGTEQRGPT